jgi:pimeloyl-ACP methyl ester carboxylesterase
MVGSSHPPRSLPPALEGEQRSTSGRAGDLAYYVAGEGPPLLLLHSINAAASAHELRPIFEHFAGSHRVFAPDLPGFGCSDRSDRDYTIGLYVAAVHDMLDEIERQAGTAPVDALALSLSAEFLARAARDRPERFRSLALVTPTGFAKGSERLRGAEGSSREVPFVHAAVTAPLLRGMLYGLLTRPATIRYFLRRTWGSSGIDEGCADYAARTARAPGAEHAPFAFLSGRLFSGDIRSVYEALRVPVWLAHGTRGDFQDFTEADWVKGRAGWRVQAFDTGALPHFEVPGPFFDAYEVFLAAPDSPGS